MPRLPHPELRRPRVTALLEALVRFPSLSGEEADIAGWLSRFLREEGQEVGRVDDNVYFSIGSGHPTLLLASHLDVVPASDGHPHPPFTPTVEGGRMYGRGTVDAKGSVAAMATALLELADEGWAPRKGRVIAAFTACEERGWPYNGLQALRPHLEPIDAALVGEPTSLRPVTAQKGLLILRVEASGRAAHAARAAQGENAILKAARDLVRLEGHRLDRVHPLLGETTATVTTIEGGTARNMVPDRCTFYLDVRTTPAYTHDELARHFEELFESAVHVHSDRLVPVETAAGERIVRACRAATGIEETIGSPTLSDWIFLKDRPVVKIGPGDSELSHTPGESMPLDELERGVAVYRRIIEEYFAP